MVDRREMLAAVRVRGPGVAIDLAVNIVLPLILYSACVARWGELGALLASSLPPVVWSVAELARHRRVDALSMFVLGGIALSILAFFGGGSARMLQLREKLVTAVIGIAFLVSALIGRPLIYELARAGMRRNGAAGLDAFEGLRERKPFRRTMTIMTVVWGIGLIVDVLIGAALIFTMSIRAYLVVGPLLGYAVTGGLSLWTFWYARRKQREGRGRQAAMQAGIVSDPSATYPSMLPPSAALTRPPSTVIVSPTT